MFISIEGIDGSGKTSQAKRLASFLDSKSIPNILTSEPKCGGFISWASDLLDVIVNEKMDAVTQLLLVNAIRKEHIETIIKPSIASGKVIICDRFVDSTVAYQGYGFGCNVPMIWDLHKVVHANFLPHKTYLVDVSVKIAKERMDERTNKSRFDKLPESFFENVRNGFLAISDHNPRIKILQGEKTEEEIFHDITIDVMKLFH